MGLGTKHLFPFIRLINKLDIKDEIKEFYFNKPDVTGKPEEEKKKVTDERSIDFIFMIIEKAENAEKEFFNFLSLYSGKTVDEIMELSLEEMFGLVKDLVTDKNFSNFFQQAVK